MSPMKVWALDHNHIQASEGRVFYTWSGGQASPENIRSMVDNLLEYVEGNQPPLGYVLHLAQNARPPASEDRVRATSAFNQCAGRLAGIAIVLEATGFASALLRGAINAVFFIQRQGFTPRVFDSIQSAADWLGPKTHTLPANIVALARHAREKMSLPGAHT